MRDSGRFHHRVALHGLGGIGKTQLALEFVHRNRNSYTDIFWLSGEDRMTLLSGFWTVAQNTQCAESQETSDEQTAKCVIRWLNQRSRWLFVIDNLGDITAVDSLLPVGDVESHVLITTRNSHSMGIPALGFEVKALPICDAVDMLLLRSAPHQSSSHTNSEIEEATKIVNELGCLPLAIEQAAAFIREGPRNICKFLGVYSKHKSDLLARRPIGNWDYPRVVTTTWAVSFEQLQRLRPEANELLKLFAFLDDEITIDLLETGAASLCDCTLRTVIQTELLFQECLAALHSFSLIRGFRNMEVISIHRLVQEIIQNEVRSESCIWKARAMTVIHGAFKHTMTGPSLWVRLRSLRKQAVHCLDAAELGCDLEVLYSLSKHVYACYQGEGQSEEGLKVAEKSLSTLKRLGGEENQFTWQAMNQVASACIFVGRYVEALEILEPLAKTLRDRFERHHKLTLDVMTNMGDVYFRQYRLDEAEAIYDETLKTIWRRSEICQDHELNQKGFDVILSMVDILCRQGRRAEATEILERGYDVAKVQLAEYNPTTIRTGNRLAELYNRSDRHKEAVVIYENSLKIYRGWEGKSIRTADLEVDVAMTLLALEKWDESLEYFELAYETYETILSIRHPKTHQTLESILHVLLRQGRRATALERAKMLYNEHESVLGPDNLYTLKCLRHIGWATFRVGNESEALQILQSCLAREEQILMEDHPETLMTLLELGICCHYIGDHEEARRYGELMTSRYNFPKYGGINNRDYDDLHLHILQYSSAMKREVKIPIREGSLSV